MEFIDIFGHRHVLPIGEIVGVRISGYPIVFNELGKMLVYMPQNNPQWQLPGGGFEQGIDTAPNHTAIRECLEETGYHIHIPDNSPYLSTEGNFYHIQEKKYYAAKHFFYKAVLLPRARMHVSRRDKDGIVGWVGLEELNNENAHFTIHPVLRRLRNDD